VRLADEHLGLLRRQSLGTVLGQWPGTRWLVTPGGNGTNGSTIRRKAPVEPTVRPKAPPPPPSPRRWMRIALLWTVFGLWAGLAMSITLPHLFGNRSLTVLSGSMEPTISTGDMVVVAPMTAMEAHVGDVVSFADPQNPEILITHRIRDIDVLAEQVRFVTKGDANSGTEEWYLDRDGTMGRVTFRVWKLGYVLFWLGSFYGRLALVVAPALLLGAYEIFRIWRPRAKVVLGEAAA
jgi:signal peptidase